MIVLKSGDWIHLAVPVVGSHSPDVRDRMNKEVTDGYEALGIKVAILSWNSGLTHPYVVAVLKRED